MIKLIATDMDGTFLDSSKRFSMEFFDIFAELRKKGMDIPAGVLTREELVDAVSKCFGN